MPGSSLWLRAFVGLLLALLPPLFLLVGASLLSESLLAEADPSLVAVVVLAGSILWAAGLAIVYARWITDDIRAFVALAQRGETGEDSGAGAAYQELASSLDERNRQVATMAREAMAVPIDDDPRAVLPVLVSAVRSVMRDDTWQCAVLTSHEAELLPPQVYPAAGSGEEPRAVDELERWAATSLSGVPAARLQGPWGAFMVVDAAVSDRVRAVLIAPWEGRPDPVPADIALLTLIGQHTGTALEHSLLFARVRRQAEELDRLAKVQADFLRGVTHDLQTPLTSIAALASELRADGGAPASASADLETITHQAERLRRLVGQLLIASRLEAGGFTPQQDVFAVQPLVERTWAALRADRPFEARTHGEPHLAVGDPDRLEQVLWALLDNAVKYSPAGSPIMVSITPAGTTVEVAVIDQGMGMDEAAQSRAFEQFFRDDRARALAPDGSGVGLYAARGLVEAMDGSVRIDSRLGGGTTVTIALPAEPAVEGDEA